MSSNSSNGWSEDNDPPDVSDVRQFSDCILYFTKSGRYQVHGLLDDKRRVGVLTLLKGDRLSKLTMSRRLKPVLITLTPGEPPQRVFIVSLVRESVSNEELEDIISRLNKSIDGLTTSEREDNAIDLITNTRARVMPGVRFLPRSYYQDDEKAPSSVNTGDLDKDGLPVLPSKDEVKAFVRHTNRGPRNSDDVKLPSTSNRLPEATSDTEVTPRPKRSDQEERQDDTKRQRTKSPSVEMVHEVGSHERRETMTQSGAGSDLAQWLPVPQSDASMTSTQTSNTQDYVTKQDFQAVMDATAQGLQDLRRQLETIVEMQKQMQAAGINYNQQPQEKFREGTIPPEQTPPEKSEAEFNLASVFPINTLTEPVLWLLKRRVVRKFLTYEVMRKVYKATTLFKPDLEHVAATFMDYVMSTRLQTHMGKAGHGKNLDFSRVALPAIFVEIIREDLAYMAKLQAPGNKSMEDFLKDRCNSTRRIHLLGSDYVSGATSVQEMAFRILHERLDFFHRHIWMFPKTNPKSWSLADEIAKSRKLNAARGKIDDDSIDCTKIPIPSKIEDLIFKSMTKGSVVSTMQHAREIEDEMKKIVLSKPRYPDNIWLLINKVVEPTAEEIAIGQQKEAANEQKRKQRAELRRAKAKAKHTPVELEDSDIDEVDNSFDSPTFKPTQHMDPETVPVVLSGSRESMQRQLFGDVSTSSSSHDDGAVVYELKGNGIVFKSQENPTTSDQQTNQVVVRPTPTLITTEILTQAAQSGIASESFDVTVDASQNITQSQEYSVVMVDPRTATPVTISGSSTNQVTSQERLIREASPAPGQQPKSVIQRYEDMENTELDYEPMSSSGSSNNSGAKAKDKGHEQTKEPAPSTRRSTRSQSREQGPQRDEGTTVAEMLQDIQRTHGRDTNPEDDFALINRDYTSTGQKTKDDRDKKKDQGKKK